MSKPKILVLISCLVLILIGSLAFYPKAAFAADCSHYKIQYDKNGQNPTLQKVASANTNYFFISPSCNCPTVQTFGEPNQDPYCEGYNASAANSIGNDCTTQGQAGATACISNNTFVKHVLQPLVNVLSALVGIAVVADIILGGIQYSIAGDKPEALGAAKKRITQGLTALLIFALLFGFIQYLIPGGIFK